MNKVNKTLASKSGWDSPGGDLDRSGHGGGRGWVFFPQLLPYQIPPAGYVLVPETTEAARSGLHVTTFSVFW